MLPLSWAGNNGGFPIQIYRNYAGAQYPMWYYRDYARVGNITLNDQTFKIALDDVLAQGDFRGDATRQHFSGVQLHVDVDGNGRFARSKRETFDVAKPFNIRGTTYEVSEISADGGILKLRKSEKPVAEVLSFEEGDTFSPFEATSLDSRKLRFPKDYKGKVVLIDFWATWCAPCVAEVPKMKEVYKKFREQGFEIIGVSLDNAGQQEKLVKFTKDKGIEWPQIYDGKGPDTDLAKLVGVGGIPHVLLVDGNNGEILATTEKLRENRLMQTVEQALQQKSPAKE